MNTENDLILRRDAIAALGDAPMNWMDTPEEIQAVNDWQAAIDALAAVPCTSFRLLELNELDICGLHGDIVIVSAPDIPELNNKMVPCLGSHKDPDGHKYVVLDGEEYSQDLIIGGFIKLYRMAGA
nr:MAG TPA: hypothetical protein [Caudoviricetes sp.]